MLYPRIVAFDQYGRGLEGLAQRSTYRARWCARGPGDPLPAPQLILGLAPRPCEPSGAGRRRARRPEWSAAPRIPRTVQGVLSNAAGRPNGVGLLGRKWTVGPFLMRFPGGASFGARGRLAFRHRGAHRHRSARARHGEFGDFADPQQRQPETIVRNFLTGQYGNGLRIVAFNTAEGWSWDVS